MRIIVLCFFELISFLTISQVSVNGYYPSGELAKEYCLNDKGILEGKALYFYENKMVSQVCFYKDAHFVGELVRYNMDGSIDHITNYSEAGVILFSKSYWEDGIIKSISFFTNSKLTTREQFNFEGKLEMIESRNNDGVYKTWLGQNGRILESSFYDNKSEHGYVTKYNDFGDVISTESW